MKTLLLVLITTAFLACSSGGGRYKAIPETSSYSDKSNYEPTLEEQTSSKEPEDKSINEEVVERKLIKEGTISFETNHIEKTRNYISRLTQIQKGYISREYSYFYDEQQRYEMTVRIPAELFDSFLDSLSGLIVTLENKDIQVKDVTEEYMDAESRIKSKKEILERYSELLKQAKTVAEMLDIEREMGNIQTEIESFQGRLKYLQNRVSYSTLNITFFEYRSAEFAFWGKIGKAFVSGWKGFLWLLIGIVNLWPVWVILSFVVWLIKRLVNRKK